MSPIKRPPESNGPATLTARHSIRQTTGSCRGPKPKLASPPAISMSGGSTWRRPWPHSKDELFFIETGPDHAGTLTLDPAAWGDVMLWRWDAPSSYHLSVVVDDALQGVTHVVRGLDLFAATPVHRLLQTLLGLPAPLYHHHRLQILGRDGRKLSKSQGDTALSALKTAGLSPLRYPRPLGTCLNPQSPRTHSPRAC